VRGSAGPEFQITPRTFARRGTQHGSGLGVHRWVLEGALVPLHWFRRPRIRWEIRDDIHDAFVTLGCGGSAGVDRRPDADRSITSPPPLSR
jgi:hypothetical protein